MQPEHAQKCFCCCRKRRWRPQGFGIMELTGCCGALQKWMKRYFSLPPAGHNKGLSSRWRAMFLRLTGRRRPRPLSRLCHFYRHPCDETSASTPPSKHLGRDAKPTHDPKTPHPIGSNTQKTLTTTNHTTPPHSTPPTSHTTTTRGLSDGRQGRSPPPPSRSGSRP